MEGEALYRALQKDPVLSTFPTCDVYSLEDLDFFVRQKNIKQPMALIVNTDPDVEGVGEHWVAIYADEKTVEYFDSYGQPPIRVGFYRLLNHLGKKWERNTRCVQQLFSSTCGHYCLYYLVLRSRGHRMRDILLPFTDIITQNDSQNDSLVEQEVRQHFNLPKIDTDFPLDVLLSQMKRGIHTPNIL
jgi:hypothetical protein